MIFFELSDDVPTATERHWASRIPFIPLPLEGGTYPRGANPPSPQGGEVETGLDPRVPNVGVVKYAETVPKTQSGSLLRFTRRLYLRI